MLLLSWEEASWEGQEGELEGGLEEGLEGGLEEEDSNKMEDRGPTVYRDS